jgi:hypothetical protein
MKASVAISREELITGNRLREPAVMIGPSKGFFNLDLKAVWEYRGLR